MVGLLGGAGRGAGSCVVAWLACFERLWTTSSSRDARRRVLLSSGSTLTGRDVAGLRVRLQHPRRECRTQRLTLRGPQDRSGGANLGAGADAPFDLFELHPLPAEFDVVVTSSEVA